MSQALLERQSPGGGLVPPPLPPGGRTGGGGDGGKDGGSAILGDPARFGMLAFLGTVTMLFVGFTSAYILRQASADWRPLSPPRILWVSTLVLIGSSVTLEAARRALRRRSLTAARRSTVATGLLGLLFLAGQLLGWRALAAQGVFLATNPHSSFFYLLTGLHGLHLLGGLVWLVPVSLRVGLSDRLPGGDPLGLVALYWHFLAALWLYLVYLLFFL
jgi:cytochrome c oxidase subunit 3